MKELGTIIFLIIIIIWLWFFNEPKYQGETAKQWFQEYDAEEADHQKTKDAFEEFKACVEDKIDNNSAEVMGIKVISADKLYNDCF